MVNKLRLIDPIARRKKELKSIWFTWCNYQQLSRRVYCRLDRFYYNRDFFDIQKDVRGEKYYVSPYTLLDHHPIIISIGLANPMASTPNPSSSFLLNVALLEDVDIKCDIGYIRMFNKHNKSLASCVDKWNQYVKNWRTSCQAVGQKLAKDRRRSELQWHSELCRAELELQYNPESEQLTQNLIGTKAVLRRMQNDKIKGWRTRVRLNWLEVNDRGSKFFFQMLRMKEAKEKIHCIWEGDRNFSKPRDILQRFSHFYRDLFTAESRGEVLEKVRCLISKLVPKKLEEEDRSQVGRPLDKEEIEKAILSLSNDKSPGLDGFPIEFYKKNIGLS